MNPAPVQYADLYIVQLGQTYSFSRSSLYSRKLCKPSGLLKEVANGEPEAAGKESNAVGKESDAAGGYSETVNGGFEVAVWPNV